LCHGILSTKDFLPQEQKTEQLVSGSQCIKENKYHVLIIFQRESAPVSEMKLAHFTERREMESHYKKPVMQKGGKIVELSWNPIGKYSL